MSAVLGIFLKLILEVVANVVTNLLNTPATTTTVKDVRGTLVTPPTPRDVLLDRYKRL